MPGTLPSHKVFYLILFNFQNSYSKVVFFLFISQCIINVTQNVIKSGDFFSGLLNFEESSLLLCINDSSYIMYLKQFFIFSIIGKHQEKSNRKIKNVEHSLC